MNLTTPFFKSMAPLLFGRPPVSALTKAFAHYSQCRCLSQLEQTFGSYFPKTLLGRTPSGLNSRKRLFCLEVVFWSFLDQVQTPNTACRGAVRKVMALKRRKFPSLVDSPMSHQTTAYCKARAKIPLDTLDKIHSHLVDGLEATTSPITTSGTGDTLNWWTAPAFPCLTPLLTKLAGLRAKLRSPAAVSPP